MSPQPGVLDEVFEHSGPTMVLDPDFRVVRVNAAHERLSGRPRAESEGRVLWQLRPDGTNEGSPYWLSCHRCMRERVEVALEDHYEPLDLWTETRVVPLATGGIVLFIRDVSELRRAERAKGEAARAAAVESQRLDAMVEAVPAGIAIADREGRIVRTNEAFRRIWGGAPASAGVVEYQNWRGHLPGTDRSASESEWAMARALATGEVVRGDLVEIERLDGSGKAYLFDTAAPIHDADGSISGAIVAALDVTAQIRAEEAARAGRARTRQLIEQAPVAIAMFDREMRYIAHSRRYLTDYHLPLQSLLGRSHHDLFSEIPSHFRAALARCLAGASERAEAEQLPRADGSSVWVRWELVPWHEDDGSIGGLVLFSEDLTRLKDTEQALADQRELLRSIIDGTPSLIAAFDREQRFLFINEAAARFHGRTKASVVGTSAVASLSAEAARSVVEAHQAVLASGVPIVEERSLVLDGELRTVTAARYPLRDTEDRIYGTATVATDITPQKRVEAALRVSEERARAALVALEEAQERQRRTELRLREAHKMQAVGQLAGGVAHDFNNLLTVILGLAEQLALALPASDPARDDVAEIQRAGQRAAGLTRQLLAFSRRQVLEPRTLDLNVLVRDAERLLRRLVPESIELNTVLARHLDPCLLDPGQVEQVLMNLVVNARDAMPEGGSLLIETANVVLDAAYVAEHPEAKPGAHVLLTVTDTGVGMTKEVQARIFEPFFTTKETGAGTGLGLATVYGIVQQSGGTIWVYSEPGEGTSFKLYFPSAAGLPVRVGAPAVETAPQRGKETILLVEDDTQVRAAVANMLRRGGYHVIPAANGGEALLICEQHTANLDLLLTDVVMPKLNGRKVAERLRELRPGLRVIFMSGYTENAIVHHGVLDSDIDFLSKPITSAQLLAKVREVLDRAP